MREEVKREIEETIRWLAERWRDAGILLPGFSLLAKGRPLPLSEIVTATRSSADIVRKAIEAGRCERDSEGNLIDLYGMSLNPTLHRIEAGKKITYSCCALWAHVIPKLLKREVRVESVDPIRREIVRLKISPAGVDSVRPAAAVATFSAVSPSEIHKNVAAAFCYQVHHFVNRRSAEQFLSSSGPHVRIITISELQKAGRNLYRAIWTAMRFPFE